MITGPFSPWPCFTEEEADAVRNVLLSNRVNYWTGEQGRLFETEFAAWCGTDFAVALTNGTLALDAALHALELQPGDEVIVPPRTFIATASSVVNAGAKPVFADVDEDSGNITAATISRAITSRTKAIICVHLGGWPCDMDPIMDLAEQHGLYVIEDCAQAHGATYKGRNVGSIGHIGAWSFCQDKIMTTGGEGGMVTTNSERFWQKMWSLKDHGKSYDAVHDSTPRTGFRWVHETFGTNYRMLEIQAVIGRIQLQKLPDWHAARTRNAQRILASCAAHADILRAPMPPAASTHAYYRCYVYLRPELKDKERLRDELLEKINGMGVPCYSGSCSEIYLEKAFDRAGLRPGERLTVARELAEASLAFLVHPTLTEEEISLTCAAIDSALTGR